LKLSSIIPDQTNNNRTPQNKPDFKIFIPQIRKRFPVWIFYQHSLPRTYHKIVKNTLTYHYRSTLKYCQKPMITRRVFRCTMFQINRTSNRWASNSLMFICQPCTRRRCSKRPDHSPIFTWTKQNRQNPWLRRPPIQPATVTYQCRD